MQLLLLLDVALIPPISNTFIHPLDVVVILPLDDVVLPLVSNWYSPPSH